MPHQTDTLASTSSPTNSTNSSRRTRETSHNLRPVRSRKDRPCDYCRRLKHTCRILVRNQACTNCTRAKRDCTFQDPPRKRHETSKTPRNAAVSPPGVEGMETLAVPNPDMSDLSQIYDSYIPTFALPNLDQTFGTIYVEPHNPGSSNVRETVQSSLAAIFEVEEVTSEDNTHYTSLDLENNESEEHHYLGPGALMHLTLKADEADGTDLNWLNLTHPQQTADLATASGSLQLSYRQVADPKRPVFFLREPSKVYGLSNASYEAERAWKTACEILSTSQAGPGEQLAQQLINVFLNSTLSALPMINKIRFQASMYAWHGAHPFPHALLVGVLAHSAVSVPALRHIWKDLWAIVLNLLDNEYRQPRLQTLQLAVLDIWGRPNLNPGGNHTAVCRAIGAAQVLGLHKDSSQWRLPRWERSTRKRIWWLIYVADKWNSLTYGRPSNIPTETTVPLPSTLDGDDAGNSTAASGTIVSFILMCRLTIILNNLLPILSDNNGDSDKFSTHRQSIMSAAIALDDLERSQLDMAMIDKCLYMRSGMASYQLCHLCLSVRLASLSLDEVISGLIFTMPFDSHPRASSVSRHIVAVFTKVVIFLEGLPQEDRDGFWAPWSSSHLTHSMSLTLRLFIRVSSINHDPPRFPSPQECLHLMDRFLTVLVSSEHSWEVASDAVSKIRILMASMPNSEELTDLKSKIGLGQTPLPSQNDAAWSEWLSLLGMEWLNGDGVNSTLVS